MFHDHCRHQSPDNRTTTNPMHPAAHIHHNHQKWRAATSNRSLPSSRPRAPRSLHRILRPPLQSKTPPPAQHPHPFEPQNFPPSSSPSPARPKSWAPSPPSAQRIQTPSPATSSSSSLFTSFPPTSSRPMSPSATSAVEGDKYLGYPIRLERWLMEGSYDRVWNALKSREGPSKEYGVFSEILTFQIRSEIASSSERAYSSLPISPAKSLLFLDSEGDVISFA
ncbi:uncharacterized protein BDZ83DRAFT_234939 [Colletotrichum acutatum]|uniref:CSN8/PSMD8/EIF3K domain-containing protein n=1 Tax=Glomerella acutata TaxID=27357 RepID=A0AAD8UAH2_GLOAC|nr:uncharacterized protein BDZ83DRAFT_234939 [Colletotrichum acutatum]KAK1703244.1 hypothetical protein BDZ83DRAFT_234939 [Colletotrichum acutatum]